MTIAFWSVFAAAMLPYVAIRLVRGRDNEAPRESEGRLTGRDARLLGAHQNAFEVFPFFAFAVVSAQIFKGPSHLVDALAALFVIVRVAHMAAYVAGKGALRSALFSLGFFAVMYGRPPLRKRFGRVRPPVGSGHVFGLLSAVHDRWPRWVSRIEFPASRRAC